MTVQQLIDELLKFDKNLHIEVSSDTELNNTMDILRIEEIEDEDGSNLLCVIPGPCKY